MLHRLTELDARIREATQSYDWTGVYPELHAFCATDLSAFYFDARKDALYCDRPDSPRRRAARTVLDHLHRCLTIWLAPVLCFTAEEAWAAQFGEAESVHLQLFPELPEEWRDARLAAKWARIRAIRTRVTSALELARRDGLIGSSLQAAIELPLAAEDEQLLTAPEWEEVAIVSSAAVRLDTARVAGFGVGRARPEMRALLEGAARGRRAVRASHALRALRRCGRVWAGLPGRRRVRRRGHTGLGLLIAILVLAADQASKWWVLDVLHLPERGQVVLLPVLNLTMVWNRGVTFGLLNGVGGWSHLVLAAVAIAVVIALGVWLRRAQSRLVAGAIGAIAGGAVGNVIDRLRFGAVVDFIHAHVGAWSW